MQFTTALVILFAATGVTATPVEPRVDTALIESKVDGEASAMEVKKGTCDKKNQQCRITIDGKPNITKCPSSPANYKCTATGKCDYDLVTRKTRCY